MGQIVHQNKADSISYEFTLKKAYVKNYKEAIEQLLKLDKNTYNQDFEHLVLQRKWLKEFGGSRYKPDIYKELKKCAFSSPEYSIFELLRIQKKGKYLDRLIFPQLLEIDFFREIEEIAIPIYFFSGRYDYHVPSVLNYLYFESLKAPKKEYIWFENSGHLPVYEENDKFMDEVLRIKNK